MYRQIIRPLLFLMNPEAAHHFTFSLIKWSFKIPGAKAIFKAICGNVSKPVEVMGLYFPNPVGLAAGFDKDAVLFEELGAFGFGFIEVGTLTPKAQDGNPKPRMFRLPADKGLINRMGFNNQGVDAAALRLQKRKSNLIIGGNIGKNKVTANEDANSDYRYCFEALFPVVDYFVVNVSSPNTPGLRALQDKEPLTKLLTEVMALNMAKSTPKPVLLKIAPDLTDEQIEEIVEIVKAVKLSGVIATNTTISRQGLKTVATITSEQGGLSGKPVTDRSTAVIKKLRTLAGPEMVIIGVGGIFNAQDAKEKLAAGANLLQVYTGFIYEGPFIVKNIVRNL
jgi:dihydroorotate dehydrogenase